MGRRLFDIDIAQNARAKHSSRRKVLQMTIDKSMVDPLNLSQVKRCNTVNINYECLYAFKI